ncbi:MAG: hypothetical protein ACRD0L_13840, partial [Acidimicrobiales bacterium]
PSGGAAPGRAAAPARAPLVSDTGSLYLGVPPDSRSTLSSLGAAGGLSSRPVDDVPTLGLARALLRVCILSAVMAGVVIEVSAHVGAGHGVGLLVRVAASVAAGVAVFAAGAAVASGLTRGPGPGRNVESPPDVEDPGRPKQT